MGKHLHGNRLCLSMDTGAGFVWGVGHPQLPAESRPDTTMARNADAAANISSVFPGP